MRLTRLSQVASKTAAAAALGAIALACALALGACVIEGEQRRGDVGERCFSDDDCKPRLICEEGLCAGSLLTPTTTGTAGLGANP